MCKTLYIRIHSDKKINISFIMFSPNQVTLYEVGRNFIFHLTTILDRLKWNSNPSPNPNPRKLRTKPRVGQEITPLAHPWFREGRVQLFYLFCPRLCYNRKVMFGFLKTNRCLRFQIFCSRMLAAFQFSIQFHFTAVVIYTVWHEIFADWRFFVFCGTD